jgi:hypothetical protein
MFSQKENDKIALMGKNGRVNLLKKLLQDKVNLQQGNISAPKDAVVYLPASVNN